MENNNTPPEESTPQWHSPQNNPEPVSWGNEQTPPTKNNENLEVNWGEDIDKELETPPLDFIAPPHITNSPSTSKYSYLGDIERIKISTLHYQFKHDNNKALSDLKEANLVKVDDDGRHSFDPKNGTELGNIIESIYNISRQMNTKIGECFVYKNQPQESTLNIFKHKPSKTFVYFLQADLDSSQLILDLSPFGGPSAKIIDSCEGIFSVIPGWCNFRFTKNLSNTEFTAIVGYFN